MRLALFGAASTALTALVVANAYLQRGLFFTTCIHLTRSSASLIVLLNLALFVTIVLAKAAQAAFFGQLRALEVEHLYERSWFAVTETCLAMTIFREDFGLLFLAFFGMLLLVKIFHWIVQDRVDFMEQSPNLTLGFHVRMVTIMGLLMVTDLALVGYAIDYTLRVGPTMMIIFGFEYTILISLNVSTFVKYVLHTIDLRGERPWEDKPMYIFYLDLVVDFFKLVTYFLFFIIVVHLIGMPLHILRDLWVTLRSFIQRCKDLIQYRRATANMQDRYPNATAEELAATDRTCIICREEMDAAVGAAGAGAEGAPDAAKKLPCGHIFHFHCLRSWLGRQQSCPT
ncbi:hypothetical protein BDK51DRAFT_26157, partial [Blyttiomyces helicus]